jgi:hypothetical protein
MSLTPILLLIGAAGLALACWTIVRGLRLDSAGYRRRQKRAGLALAGLLLALLLVQAGHGWKVVQRLTAPEVDGTWAAVAIDGRAVPWREWRFSVERGKVSGGRDSCNDWSFDKPEAEGGPATITTTLVGCPEDDPVRKAYWALALGASPELRGDGTLRLAGRGHEALLRRCRWVNEPLPPGTSGTPPRACVPE